MAQSVWLPVSENRMALCGQGLLQFLDQALRFQRDGGGFGLFRFDAGPGLVPESRQTGHAFLLPPVIVADVAQDPEGDFIDHRLRVADQGDLGGIVLADLRGVDVDVDQAARRGKPRIPTEGGHLVQTGAHHQQQIVLARFDIGFRQGRSAEPQDTQRQRVVLGERPLGLGRGGHGDA